MKHSQVLTAGLAWFFATLILRSEPPAPISVADVVRTASIGDPRTLDWNEGDPLVAATSPDGSHAALMVRQGNPATGRNEARLYLVPLTSAVAGRWPEPVAQFESASNFQPMALLRWLGDSNGLVFAGAHGDAKPQVFRFDLRTAQLTQLTHEPDEILWFDVTPDGSALALFTRRPDRPPLHDPDNRDGFRVTGTNLFLTEQGIDGRPAPVIWHDLMRKTSRRLEWPAPLSSLAERPYENLWGGLSPDGRFGIQVTRLREAPAWWKDYSVFPEFQEFLARGSNRFGRHLLLYDFHAGSVRRLTTAPSFMYRPAPLWIEGGRTVVLADIVESLADQPPEERAFRANHRSILAIDPVTLATTRIASIEAAIPPAEAASWDQSSSTLVVTFAERKTGKNRLTRYYRHEAGQWMEAEPTTLPPAKIAAVEFVVEQSLNERPRLVAYDRPAGVKRILLDPNPWLADRLIGRVEPIAWRTRTGREWQGGLYYPPDYIPGRRYPLVLQTHGFAPDKFSLHGIARNFFAQPLAARGIMVLQVREDSAGLGDTPEEWPVIQAGYEGAIDHLDRIGLIDRQRVGIQGWSATGPFSTYTVTHSSYPFAACALTSTADYGWTYYFQANGARPGTNDHRYGAPPFGEGLRQWEKHSPSFNLDKVKTPTFIWNGGFTLWWDWYTGLQRFRVPVEFWAVPDVTHDVFKAKQRLLLGTLLVDWFVFWLKDEEDIDPTKAEQYARWREQRRIYTRHGSVSTERLPPE